MVVNFRISNLLLNEANYDFLKYNLIMKKLFYLLILFSVSLKSFSQDLMEVALQNKSIIILDEALVISDLDLENSYNDKALIEDFKIQVKNQKESKWNKSDFKNKIVVTKNEKIDEDKVLALSTNLDDVQKKDLKMAIRVYNTEDNNWRVFPVEVSKPLYSKQKDYAIIIFINGNNGGEIILYHLENNEWKSIAQLSRWVY